MLPSSHRSAATPLAWAYTALVLYASLFPFGDWRWPPGQGLSELVVLPWPRYQSRFDIAANLVGYMPLGLLLGVAQLRKGRSASLSMALATLGAGALSFATEFTQHFLPSRYPSTVDLLLNTAGGALGGALAVLSALTGVLHQLRSVRQRWFSGDAAIGLSLLALWPVALLSPTPVALGLGQVFERLRAATADLLRDVPWAAPATAWLDAAAPWPEPAGPAVEGLVQVFGLLSPCLLAYAVAPAGWRRGALAVLLLVAGFAASTLSTMLNFGPEHALAWANEATALAWAVALLLAALGAGLPARAAATLGLVALTTQVVLISQVGGDPYYAQNLQAWEQGRFIRLYGLVQWLGWLWPFLAMGWLFTRLNARR